MDRLPVRLRADRRVAAALALVAAAALAGCTPRVSSVTNVADVAPPGPSGADAARELTAEEQARHVLDRLAFGPRPGDVARVQAMGVDRWIAAQLDPARLDDSAMERRLSAFPAIRRSADELLREAPPPGLVFAAQAQAAATPGRPGQQQGDGRGATAADSLARRQAARAAVQRSQRFAGELLAARVARAVESERQLHEVLTDFWLNHFSVFIGKGQLRHHVGAYERDAIRPHVLGRFRDLLGAVAHSPAMLLYLDNAQSVADSARPTLATPRNARRERLVRRAIAQRQAGMTEAQRARVAALAARRPQGLNENYARELLELHTLGVDGGYTQQDIIEVARAFTGWTVRPPRSGATGFWFNGAAHDAGAKVVLGTRLAGGQGVEDGEQVLDLLARHPSTARFIARKLAVRFVSDTPPEALVARAAEAFRRTDGNLRDVVRTIVTSPEFFSRAAYRAKVKTPFEVVVSAARAIGARADTTPVTAQVIARLGQPLFGRQSPDGWPETGREWMNTGAILGRINFGLTVAADRLPGARLAGWPEYAALREASREVQVDRVIAAFLGGTASPETREILTSGVNPMLPAGADGSRGDDVPAGTAGAGVPADMMTGVTSDPAADRSADAAGERGKLAPGLPRLAARRPGTRAPARLAPPRLSGLDQVIGLALGSPEFQRR